MAGADIKIVSPEYNNDLDLFMPITIENLKEALKKHPDIDALYLTSPNYEGLSVNYEEVKDLFKDKIVIVDEAHGAHFYFNKSFPKPAIPSGIDVVTNSVHKSLGGLNATALIHVSKNSRIPA